MRRSAVLLAVALLAAGCGDDPSEPNWDAVLEQVRTKRTAWQAVRPASYTMIQRHQCLCPPELQRPAVVTVVNEAVQSAIWQDDGQPVEARDLDSFVSVAELFTIAENAAQAGVPNMSVTFHAQLHYPTVVFVDYDLRGAEDDIVVYTSELQAVE